MTIMRGSENFLNKPADELQEFLLGIARADAAPAGARERSLEKVAAAALGVSVASGTAVLGSQSALLKGTTWLVLKWLTIGASSGLLALGVAQGIQELTTRSAPVASAPQTLSLQPSLPAPTATAPLAAEPVPVPEAEGATARTPPMPTAPAAAASSAPALDPEPSAPRAPGKPSVGVFPPPNTRSSLTHELTLIEQTRGALKRGAIPTALKLLDQYRVEFPHGSMESQADALRVQALAEESVVKDQKP